MKIVAISASPRGAQSRTLKLVQAVADGAMQAGGDVEVVDACKLRINYCTGCGVCYAKGRCVHRDDFEQLYPRILAADGLILGSPNYFRSVTAQMKALIDRMSDAVHCQLLTGKYVCSVATAGGPAHQEVTEYLNRLLIGFGAWAVGSVGASPGSQGTMDAAEPEALALGRTLVESIRAKRVYPEQEPIHAETRSRFKHLVTLNKDLWQHEWEHWHRTGEV